MRKTECLIDALFLMLYQILSCAVIYLAAWGICQLISRFIVLEYFPAAVIQAVLTFAGVGILLGIYAYRTTYRAGELSIPYSIAVGALASVVHLLIAAVFNYSAWVSGCIINLSGLLTLGSGFSSSETLSEISGWLPPLLFLAVMLVYQTSMIPIRVIARNRRLSDRMELTGKM